MVAGLAMLDGHPGREPDPPVGVGEQGEQRLDRDLARGPLHETRRRDAGRTGPGRQRLDERPAHRADESIRARRPPAADLGFRVARELQEQSSPGGAELEEQVEGPDAVCGDALARGRSHWAIARSQPAACGSRSSILRREKLAAGSRSGWPRPRALSSRRLGARAASSSRGRGLPGCPGRRS